MALSLLAFHDAASDLLGCVCSSLATLPTEAPGLDGCPCRACVVPGQPAADACGEGCGKLEPGQYGGQLTVNVVRTFASDRRTFPREVQAIHDARACTPPQVTGLELQVTLFRCVPGSDKNGCPPSCDDLGASARQLHADMLAVQRGILCCYADTGPATPTGRGREFVLGQARTVGPQGDCVGLTQSVTVMLADCLVCLPEGAP